jgi:hypothetical protein
VKEYIASVRDSGGDEVFPAVRYNMMGTLTITSFVKISGNVVVSGDPFDTYSRDHIYGN